MVFLAILVPVVVEALTIANRASVVSERTAIAVQLAENRLNELVATGNWTTADSTGDFGDDYPGYRWALARGDWEYAGAAALSELKLTVTFPVQGQERTVQLATLAGTTTSGGTQ